MVNKAVRENSGAKSNQSRKHCLPTIHMLLCLQRFEECPNTAERQCEEKATKLVFGCNENSKYFTFTTIACHQLVFNIVLP